MSSIKIIWYTVRDTVSYYGSTGTTVVDYRYCYSNIQMTRNACSTRYTVLSDQLYTIWHNCAGTRMRNSTLRLSVFTVFGCGSTR